MRTIDMLSDIRAMTVWRKHEEHAPSIHTAGTCTRDHPWLHPRINSLIRVITSAKTSLQCNPQEHSVLAFFYVLCDLICAGLTTRESVCALESAIKTQQRSRQVKAYRRVEELDVSTVICLIHKS